MADKVIYAMYDDDDVLKDMAQRSWYQKVVHITEVFSPFPIHGIDPIIGVKNTRLGIMAFMLWFDRIDIGNQWECKFFHD
jgi:hypothetical protein